MFVLFVIMIKEGSIFFWMVNLPEVSFVEHSFLVVVSISHFFTILVVIQLAMSFMFVLFVIVIMEDSIVNWLVG